MIHDPYLESINIVIDPVLRALCCNLCLVALTPAQVYHHIAMKHKGLKVDRACLEKAVNTWSVHENLPYTPDGEIPYLLPKSL